jgi:hypothetical protein
MLWTTGLGRFGGGLSPWTDLERMENEMNRLFDNFFGGFSLSPWAPLERGAPSVYS